MNCDRIARWYRWMEYLGMGRTLERRRTEFLRTMVKPRRILLLGDGDGRFLRRLLDANPFAHIDSVDVSGKMIAEAKMRVSFPAKSRVDDVNRVEFYHADARIWVPPGGKYDLIVTHFFLDCFSEDELRLLIPRLAATVTGTGSWIVSEFRQPSAGWAATRAKLWMRGLYLLFGWTTGLQTKRLPDFRPFLDRAGFDLAEEVVANAGLLVSQRWTRKPSKERSSEALAVTSR